MTIKVYNELNKKFNTVITEDFDDLRQIIFVEQSIFYFPTREDANAATEMCGEYWETLEDEYYYASDPIYNENTLYTYYNEDIYDLDYVKTLLKKELKMYEEIKI